MATALLVCILIALNPTGVWILSCGEPAVRIMSIA